MTTENGCGKGCRPPFAGREGASLIGVLLFLLLVAAGVYWWMGRGKQEAPPEETPEAPVEIKVPETILTKLRREAEGGDAVAAWKLGKIYAEGLEAEQDWGRAAEWYRKAALAGNAEGEYQLGLLFEEGKGVGQDSGQAAGWYRKAAELGHADAQWKLGICHRDGKGVARDSIWAKVWLEKAARQGQEEAKAALESLVVTLKQEGVNPAMLDRAEAEAGDTAAQNRMGRRCMEGIGVEKDEAAGAEWYRKAAEQGSPEGQCRWGDCLRLGRGAEKDEKAAEEWYLKAAEQGFAEGARLVGRCRMAKGDKEAAANWFQKAAEEGDAEGQYLLALCFQKGMGTEKNPARAKKWLKTAAQNGHAKAKSALAALSDDLPRELLGAARQGNRRAQYELGRRLVVMGREKDGAGWILAAAQGGVPEAAVWLANHYEGRDARQSFLWWSRAADYGSAEAQWQMVDLCRSGTGTVASDTEALRWARKAAEGGNRRAMWLVAEWYEKGIGCRQDYAEAKRWYSRVGDQNEVDRMDRLISGKDGVPSGYRHKSKGIYQYQGLDGKIHTRTK